MLATSKTSSYIRSNASTKFKGKEIAKPITPPSESASEEDSDPEQAQRDKDMQKNLALIAKKSSLLNTNSTTEAIGTMKRFDSMYSPNMCDNDVQHDQNVVECDDERVALANLIANLKLDVDENIKIQKQLKKVNTSLAHELKECKSFLAETSRTLGESNSIWDSCLIL
ncbi:hypothetical protein Tco_0237946 [Tanacetum coccineum]